MYTLANPTPRRGLSVPVLSACNQDGVIQEADQRRIVQHVISDGFGADMIFCNGTNGEWNRLAPAECDRVIAITAEEVRRENSRLTAAGHQRVEVWAGITGHTVAECVQHLDAAVEHGVDGVVFAPLSVRDLPGVVEVFHEVLTERLDAAGRHVSLLLYDNADIAVDPKVPHLRTRDVKQLSRLDYVVGIKVSASPRVLGNYMKAALHFNAHHEFAIYVGDAFQIFTLFRPRRGWWGVVADYWQRYWLQAALPSGVVASYANVFPREWQRAWLACDRGEVEQMTALAEALGAFRKTTRFRTNGTAVKRTLACLKLALAERGVLHDPSVAPGTPPLTSADSDEFRTRLRDAAARITAATEARWRTPQALPAARRTAPRPPETR